MEPPVERRAEHDLGDGDRGVAGGLAQERGGVQVLPRRFGVASICPDPAVRSWNACGMVRRRHAVAYRFPVEIRCSGVRRNGQQSRLFIVWRKCGLFGFAGTL
jgi:hypothetical protein